MTRRERFLSEMDQGVPWAPLVALIEPHYPKAGNGIPPMPRERILRIHFMQQWFNLSDPAMEDALCDSESMRRLAGIELGDDTVPDESTILRFWHLLEGRGLSEQIFALVRGLLEHKRLLLKSGTIVDATIIDAPPSTKNAAQARDPEIKQGKKNARDWHFGMKEHVGTDWRGLVHTLVTTHAGAADITPLPQLLHGEERELYGGPGLLEQDALGGGPDTWGLSVLVRAKRESGSDPGRPAVLHDRKPVRGIFPAFGGAIDIGERFLLCVAQAIVRC